MTIFHRRLRHSSPSPLTVSANHCRIRGLVPDWGKCCPALTGNADLFRLRFLRLSSLHDAGKIVAIRIDHMIDVERIFLRCGSATDRLGERSLEVDADGKELLELTYMLWYLLLYI